ncbi:hypothetical protein NQ318_014727 [Aromia moschata]|uniref:Uncharacterized protein n=1 Tax=Aromia moschata TaxID=1265417 RepID=A0AAV8ZD28_9CUCU|nr:hypothetical protein NQ318_014727 [Aromia moschata]
MDRWSSGLQKFTGFLSASSAPARLNAPMLTDWRPCALSARHVSALSCLNGKFTGLRCRAFIAMTVKPE